MPTYGEKMEALKKRLDTKFADCAPLLGQLYQRVSKYPGQSVKFTDSHDQLNNHPSIIDFIATLAFYNFLQSFIEQNNLPSTEEYKDPPYPIPQ